MARPYQTLGRRFLAILEVGGPRKPRILRALAKTEREFRSTINRLRRAGLIVLKRHRGGGVYALAQVRKGVSLHSPRSKVLDDHYLRLTAEDLHDGPLGMPLVEQRSAA